MPAVPWNGGVIVTATLYIDGAEHCTCELRVHTADVGGEKRMVPGVMRVEPSRRTGFAVALDALAGGQRVTVRYPFGPAETREATVHYAGGYLLADTRREKEVAS